MKRSQQAHFVKEWAIVVPLSCACLPRFVYIFSHGFILFYSVLLIYFCVVNKYLLTLVGISLTFHFKFTSGEILRVGISLTFHSKFTSGEILRVGISLTFHSKFTSSEIFRVGISLEFSYKKALRVGISQREISPPLG